jgi:hypothetical protein
VKCTLTAAVRNVQHIAATRTVSPLPNRKYVLEVQQLQLPLSQTYTMDTSSLEVYHPSHRSSVRDAYGTDEAAPPCNLKGQQAPACDTHMC